MVEMQKEAVGDASQRKLRVKLSCPVEVLDD